MKLGHRLLPALFGIGVLVLAGSSCAPGTDGILIAEAEAQDVVEETVPDGPPIIVDLPVIPVVRLPAISAAGEYDALLEERLSALSLTPVEGVEIVNVQCENGEIVYSGDQSSDVFADADLGFGESFTFEITEDGTATYVRQDLVNKTSIRTFADGSGEFIESGPIRTLTIAVNADGSGEYYNKGSISTTTVEAAGDGSGVYYREGIDHLLTVTLADDGSGRLFSEDPDQKITIDARHDGTGQMFYRVGERTVTVLVRQDGSWEVQDTDFGHSLSVKVDPDGSGQYRERGTGQALTLDFAADGTSVGPDIVLPERPQFAVADQFPRLGTLATITPPCATVVRFDSALFFEVDDADLRPEARSLLAEIAPALIEADRSIEINGHTDATGSDEYNLDLSQRRAQSVADELRSLGVAVEFTVQGFGESRPVAPNHRDDGTDDPAGQSRNRRVELVING